MFALILLLFFAAGGLIAWATHAAITGRVPLWARITYVLVLVGGFAAAYYSTFSYIYFANANARLHGWPVPQVIFQRDGPGQPWLDFVGPTVVLAYPMNVVLFSFIPALVILCVHSATRRTDDQTGNTLVGVSSSDPRPTDVTGIPSQSAEDR